MDDERIINEINSKVISTYMSISDLRRCIRRNRDFINTTLGIDYRDVLTQLDLVSEDFRDFTDLIGFES